jgi:alpha-N-acetylglucosaminidase
MEVGSSNLPDEGSRRQALQRRTFLGTSLALSIPRRIEAALSNDSFPSLSPQDHSGVSVNQLVIIHNPNSSPETAAAQELQSFIRQMTGGSPRLLKDSTSEDVPRALVSMLVGRTRAVEKLISTGMIGDPATKHPEAYLVKSLSEAGSKQIVFLGATGIGTLYAVYHYLEKYCGVGFFYDGDQVPRREQVRVEDIEISTQPHFGERMTMNLTLYWYSTPWWEWEDWKKYIDWMIRNRYNILSLWDTPGEDLAWQRTWTRFGVHISDHSYSGPPYGIFTPIKYGVHPPSLAVWREGQSELNRKIIDYARARGMRTVAPAVSGIVPPEFASVCPKARIFQVSWSTFPKQSYLHPSEPLYHDVGKAFLEEYVSLYGTDQLYWLENYLECEVEGPKELQEEIRREIAGANFQVVNEVDPKGVGILSGWPYSFSRLAFAWTPQLVREHLDRVPPERVRILDQAGDSMPLYKQMDYFFGRPWHFGVIHSSGGATHLHGNMPLLERQFKKVAQDEQAEHCVGFSSTEEIIGHNYFYYQFLAKLAWNPSEVDVRSFTAQYARARYGEAAAPKMMGVLQELLASVYGPAAGSGGGPLTQPLYWHRLAGDTISFNQGDVQPSFTAPLRRALELALEEKQGLSENPFYLRDLNDIARQYLAEVFNAQVVSLNRAYARLDGVAFEQVANVLETVLQRIETLLSHDDNYWLSPIIEKAKQLPGAPSDVDRRAREIPTLWVAGNDVLLDYASRDYYEMVQGYYRPRVHAYIQKMRQRLKLGQRRYYRLAELSAEYGSIERRWVDEGFPLVNTKPDPHRVIPLVEDILREKLATEES